MKNEIVLFETNDKSIMLPVQVSSDTVWLTQAQMVELFTTTKQNVSLHINNCFKEGELDKESVVKESLTTAADGKKYKTRFYNLDVIISVGYRVKSQRGVEFRKWANRVLKEYILQGYSINKRRMNDIGNVIRLMKRTESGLDAGQVMSVAEKYSTALDLLDSYDHQNMVRPQGTNAVYVLTYEECRKVIDQMGFGAESELFGNEKDDSFKGSIGNIYQSYDGHEIYTEETIGFYQAMGCYVSHNPIKLYADDEPYDIQMEYSIGGSCCKGGKVQPETDAARY